MPEDMLAPSTNDVSILERFGLHSVDMTEEEVESAFVQLALAFRCDQYTLERRLQAEQRDHTIAEENIRLELERSRDAVQSLKAACPDARRLDILQRLELGLQAIGDGFGSFSVAAELLGTVHQEARVCRAVELMEIHVEHLKLQHTKESVELEETRADGHMILKQGSIQRRRVSITLIPTQAQLSDLEDRHSESCKAGSKADTSGPDDASRHNRQQQSPTDVLLKGRACQAQTNLISQQQRRLSMNSGDQEADTLQVHSMPQETLRHCKRRKRWAEPNLGDNQVSSSDQFTMDLSLHSFEQRPLATWISHCHFVLLWLFLLAFSFLVFLGVLLVFGGHLRVPLFWI